MTIPVTAHPFDNATLSRVSAIGGVYVLLRQTTLTDFTILYVGLSEDLRRRLCEHLNNPPIRGITHFHVEPMANAVQRSLRERYLISVFNPPGNVHYTR